MSWYLQHHRLIRSKRFGQITFILCLLSILTVALDSIRIFELYPFLSFFPRFFFSVFLAKPFHRTIEKRSASIHNFKTDHLAEPEVKRVEIGILIIIRFSSVLSLSLKYDKESCRIWWCYPTVINLNTVDRENIPWAIELVGILIN